MAIRLIFLVVLLPTINNTHAQYNISQGIDSVLINTYHEIDSHTAKLIYSPSKYIEGKLYYPKGNKTQHPYFQENIWKPGMIFLNGINYPISMMKYDIEKDVLVIMQIENNKGFPIELAPALIKEFYIENHHFVFLEKPKKRGYYSQQNKSKTKVWAKWEKNAHFGGKNQYSFKTQVIIEKDNIYHEINNLSNLNSLFPEKREEIIQFEKKNNLKFRRDKVNSILKIITYYDMLSK